MQITNHLVPLTTNGLYYQDFKELTDEKIISLFQNRAFRSSAYFSPYNILRNHIRPINQWIGTYLQFYYCQTLGKSFPFNNPTCCEVTTQALLEWNPFQQKHYALLKDFVHLREELQNDEEG